MQVSLVFNSVLTYHFTILLRNRNAEQTEMIIPAVIDVCPLGNEDLGFDEVSLEHCDGQRGLLAVVDVVDCPRSDLKEIHAKYI